MTLAVVILLTVLTHTAFAGARVGASLFALALGASPLEVGAIGALFAALPMFLSVHVGRAVDRIGLRAPMVAGTVLCTAGAALEFAVPRLWTLYAAATLIGSGLMVFMIAASNAVGAIGAPADRPRNFSMLALGFSVSGFLGPVLTGIAIDRIGHVPAFLMLAAFPLAALVALASGRVTLPQLAPPARRSEQRLGDLLGDPRLRAVLIASALFNMAWDVFFFLMPIHGTALGLSASTIGAILGLFAAATFVVRIVLPTLSRHFSEWPLVAASLAIAAAFYAVFPLFDSVPVLMALAFVLGIGLGMSQPMIMLLLYATAPAGRTGEAVGIRTSVLNFIQMAVPLGAGALGAAVGVAPIFWSMAAATAGGAVFARRRR